MQFGLSLRGSLHYFSEPKNITLQPLRADGADVLDPSGGSEILKIILRRYRIQSSACAHRLSALLHGGAFCRPDRPQVQMFEADRFHSPKAASPEVGVRSCGLAAILRTFREHRRIPG